jgi:hypothetical protein
MKSHGDFGIPPVAGDSSKSAFTGRRGKESGWMSIAMPDTINIMGMSIKERVWN